MLPDPGADALAFVSMEAVVYDGPPPKELYVTHEGSFKVLGTTLRCYQLSDGRRVIDGRDIKGFFRIPDHDPEAAP